MPSTNTPKKPQDHKKKNKKPKPVIPQVSKGDRDYSAGWGAEVLYDLEVPSGKVAQVRRPGIQGLMATGLIDSLDGLTGIVRNELIPAGEGRPTAAVDYSKLAQDTKALTQLMEIADQVCLEVVVQPHLEPSPENRTDRVPGTLYVDMVDFEDKMFIMQFAMGGTAEIETFRPEPTEDVASVDSGEDAEVQAV